MRLIDADRLKEYIDAQKGRPFIGCTIGEALKIMTDEQPTVDAVEVVHGRWIRGKCDQCGCHAPFWCMASTYYKSGFCPDCGARMDGKGNGNETD